MTKLAGSIGPYCHRVAGVDGLPGGDKRQDSNQAIDKVVAARPCRLGYRVLWAVLKMRDCIVFFIKFCIIVGLLGKSTFLLFLLSQKFFSVRLAYDEPGGCWAGLFSARPQCPPARWYREAGRAPPDQPNLVKIPRPHSKPPVGNHTTQQDKLSCRSFARSTTTSASTKWVKKKRHRVMFHRQSNFF